MTIGLILCWLERTQDYETEMKTSNLKINFFVCCLLDNRMILLINNKVVFQLKTNVTCCRNICLTYHLIANYIDCTYLITASYILVCSALHKYLCSLDNNNINEKFSVFAFIFSLLWSHVAHFLIALLDNIK